MSYGRERRKHVRLPLGFSVVNFESRLPHISIRYNGSINDISEGGMGIRADKIPESGTIIILDFNLPKQKEKFDDVKSLVRWSYKKRFGVEFIALSDKYREIIRKYLDEKE